LTRRGGSGAVRRGSAQVLTSMKIRTVTFKIDLPANDEELLAGLKDLRQDPRLSSADRALAAAKETLDQAQRELQRTDREVQRLRDAITRGAATAPDLEKAILTQRRAALLIWPAEKVVTEAERDVAAAIPAARERALKI